MTLQGVDFPETSIAAFCRRNRIRRLSLFGSILRDDFGSTSDVDVLVEFEPGRVPGFLGMARLELELGHLLGRKVDLRTPAELSRYFREEVLREAVPQYVEA
jgi:predicted nucleotidyltransferase